MLLNKPGEILVVNKSCGWTSFDVVAKIRKLYQGPKVGHAGTLDPLAEGVLLILVGKATKRQNNLMSLDKEYEFEVVFGIDRDTYDREGQIVFRGDAKAIRSLKKEQIEEFLPRYQGEIEQTVPPFSATRVNGKRLYKLARQGKIAGISLPRKIVTVKELELISFQPYRNSFLWRKERLPKAFFRLVCTKGTFVRSIAHDLGQDLNIGAFASRIVRTRVGEYSLDQAKTIEEISREITGKKK